MDRQRGKSLVGGGGGPQTAADSRGAKFEGAPARLDSLLMAVPNNYNCHVQFSSTPGKGVTVGKERGMLHGVWRPREALLIVSPQRGIAFLDPNGMLLLALKPDVIDRVMGSGQPDVFRVYVHCLKVKDILVEIKFDPARREKCVVSDDPQSVSLLPPRDRVEAFYNALRGGSVCPSERIYPDGKLPPPAPSAAVVAAPREEKQEVVAEAPQPDAMDPPVETADNSDELFFLLREVERLHVENMALMMQRQRQMRHAAQTTGKQLDDVRAYNLAMLLWKVAEQHLERHFDLLARRTYLKRPQI